MIVAAGSGVGAVVCAVRISLESARASVAELAEVPRHGSARAPVAGAQRNRGAKDLGESPVSDDHSTCAHSYHAKAASLMASLVTAAGTAKVEDAGFGRGP